MLAALLIRIQSALKAFHHRIYYRRFGKEIFFECFLTLNYKFIKLELQKKYYKQVNEVVHSPAPWSRGKALREGDITSRNFCCQSMSVILNWENNTHKQRERERDSETEGDRVYTSRIGNE